MPISLSVAEAEYYALVRGACYGLGMQANFHDWGIEIPVRVFSDSKAGRSFAKRQGLGKQRHVQTRYLWLQSRVKMLHLDVRCILGTENAADLFTKVLSGVDQQRYCHELGLRDR